MLYFRRKISSRRRPFNREITKGNGQSRSEMSRGSIFLSWIENGYKDSGKAVNVPLVRPPTGSHKYGASYGQLRAINRDFISILATPRYAGYCVIPNWSLNSMRRDSGSGGISRSIVYARSIGLSLVEGGTVTPSTMFREQLTIIV